MVYQLLNTLYVTQPETYLHIEDGAIRVDVSREKRAKIPLHHLGAVVCLGPTTLVSAPLVYEFSERGISLVYCDSNGRFKARIEGPTSGNVLLRQVQFRTSEDSTRCQELAMAFVGGKIRNSRQVILRGSRESAGEMEQKVLKQAAEDLGIRLKGLPEVTSMDAIRGVEGEAAKRYFEVFSHMIRADAREAFQLKGRNRRPPRDRINALLSFLYSLLMNDCRSAVECVGLDPQMGFLHVPRPGRASLALDLMEEFRPFLADRIALSLINRLQIKADDFIEQEGGAILLKDDARKTLLTVYQERKKESVTHPFLSEKLPLGLVPQIQARILARYLRGDTTHYIPFTLK
jgi:CRISPR-associated protein Cas1